MAAWIVLLVSTYILLSRLTSVSSSSQHALFQSFARSNASSSGRVESGRRFLLDYINRPFVKSFNLSDGSVVDCVRIEDQLGIQHPLLKNHKILRKPTILQPQSSDRSASSRSGRFKRNATSSSPWQLFHHEHNSCPDATVPVRRLLPKDLDRMQTPEVFLHKYPQSIQSGTHRIPASPNSRSSRKKRRRRRTRRDHHLTPPSVDGHQYAIVQAVGSFSGSQAYLSIWDPAVATSSDFSLSQLWLGGGSHESINTVEAGWQVYELLNGDRSPHLFIFWTADSYKNSGCYNLRCPGFIQTSPNVLLGGAISSISSPDSSLFFKKFLIFKDPVAWWLQIDDEWVGYWPASLFTTLGQSSQWMQWGGEVCLSGASDGPELSTQMGSGFFPAEGNTRAASQCELAYLDDQMRQFDAVDLAEFSTDPECYTARKYFDRNWGSYIIFGGRGCSKS
ncbi:uncharacterized protein LOC9653081 [Selaginella moellendorffii]|uniref:uncharacterized protein LOC9653081 n=1 Tax=Selaginella moellendorffii TaxID=88036 RepID=UPI000D1C9486|nr:uncharacterized protein LOC9653081 [Selaginella moellendorffii]|eukprot:XP_024539017.1 uncharacterized protein LOC9653081 [Selaginella moellendorffii]